MLANLHERNSPGYRPLPPVEKQLWKNLWKLKTSPKIRHFLWRAMSGALAVAEKLQSRGLCSDVVCKACGQAPETICHVPFTCPTATEVWRSAHIQSPPASFSQNSVFLNLHFLVACTKRTQSQQSNIRAFPWIMWNLWKNRNALVFDRCRITAASCVSKSLEESDIWYAVNEDHQKKNLPLEPTAPLQDRWKAPPLRYIKCNVGTAWNESSMMCGASWITRDAQGVPLHHSRRAFPSHVSKREADLQALLWAIEAMDNMKHRNVICETSSVEVRDVLLNVCHFPELKYLTDHLHRLLQGLGDWFLNHVFSSKNKVAFAIAESVINHHLSQSYVALGGPRWLAQTVQMESRSV